MLSSAQARPVDGPNTATDGHSSRIDRRQRYDHDHGRAARRVARTLQTAPSRAVRPAPRMCPCHRRPYTTPPSCLRGYGAIRASATYAWRNGCAPRRAKTRSPDMKSPVGSARSGSQPATGSAGSQPYSRYHWPSWNAQPGSPGGRGSAVDRPSGSNCLPASICGRPSRQQRIHLGNCSEPADSPVASAG